MINTQNYSADAASQSLTDLLEEYFEQQEYLDDETVFEQLLNDPEMQYWNGHLNVFRKAKRMQYSPIEDARKAKTATQIL